MIQINQSNKTRDDSQNLTRFLNPFEMKVDLDAIYEDILKIQNLPVKGKIEAANANKVIKYLRTIEKEALSHEGDLIPMNWEFSGNKLISKPIQMINLPEYDIISADYFKPDSGYTVRIALDDIADAIAYELSYTEFSDVDTNETFESIDKKLDNASIIGIVPIELLKSVYLEERPYIHSRSKTIYDSSYFDRRNKKMQDYFYEDVEQSETYNIVVEQSCIKAASIIANELSRKKQVRFMCKKNPFRLLSVSAREITFNIDASEELLNEWESNFKETGIVIRVFGRNFGYKPEITIF